MKVAVFVAVCVGVLLAFTAALFRLAGDAWRDAFGTAALILLVGGVILAGCFGLVWLGEWAFA